jgi:hypothetical protein
VPEATSFVISGDGLKLPRVGAVRKFSLPVFYGGVSPCHEKKSKNAREFDGVVGEV